MIYVLIMVATLHTNSYHVSELNTFNFKPMCDKAAKAHTLTHEKNHAFVCIGRKIDVN